MLQPSCTVVQLFHCLPSCVWTANGGAVLRVIKITWVARSRSSWMKVSLIIAVEVSSLISWGHRWVTPGVTHRACYHTAIVCGDNVLVLSTYKKGWLGYHMVIHPLTDDLLLPRATHPGAQTVVFEVCANTDPASARVARTTVTERMLIRFFGYLRIPRTWKKQVR